MKVFLNRVDGIDDAIISMFFSKRHMNRALELDIRSEVCDATILHPGTIPFGALDEKFMSERLRTWLASLFKWGVHHMTMLRFIDLSFTVYGLHRAAQDDLDAHAMRMNNRIIRASTRLGTFESGEMSDWYSGKIVPTDVALAVLGITMPGKLEYEGKTYLRAANGYILEGMESRNDVKRGLYMLSIPSDFIFRIQLTEFAHVYKERNQSGSAHPELKAAVESMAKQVEEATAGLVTKELLLAIPN